MGKPYSDKAVEYFVREHLTFGDLRQVDAQTLGEMRKAICADQPIVSDEILSGVGFAHGLASNSLLQILDNLDLLTEGDFVAYVVFRRPKAFLRSYFGQLVKMGGRFTFDQFCSLVLLRPYHWLFRSLEFGPILRSTYYREGKLRPVLFEDLFGGNQLGAFMEGAFGVTIPEHALTQWSGRSDTDSVLDYMVPRIPVNPNAWIEMQVTRPSIDEHMRMDTLPEAVRDLHRPLWTSHRAEHNWLMQQHVDVLRKARELLGMRGGKRPDSQMFRTLLDTLAQANAGVAEEFPELGFARHSYFA